MVNEDTAQDVSGDELVEVQTVCPEIRIEMKYATNDNFMHRKLYSSARCLLRRKVAKRLCKAQHILEKKGYGLKVWDAYRPLSVQQEMWKIIPNPDFVADPRLGSRHNRGAAVDVTLVNLETGQEVLMPTKFD
ncbi:MAG: M15 family metallopeptidase, partial [Candidatus Ranarchaeia archaeon]